ncbi:MAG: hypothetical protein IPK16_14000 [Anaerolineales bacterium]|nr:hypothetical protein [Anaerolineales bacterium]
MGANTRPSGGYGAPGYWAGNAVNRNIGIVNASAGTGTRPPLPHQKAGGSDWFWLASDPDWKGNLMIANEAGARVGVAGGALMHEISGTVPIIPLNYVLRPAAPSYFVPSDNYRVVLESAENAPVVTQLRYLGPGFGFFADSIDLAPASRITMAIQAASPAMTLSSNDATQPIDLTYGYSFTANSPAGRVIKLAGVELGAGSQITTSLQVTNHVAVLGAGATAKVYDLHITTTGTALAEPGRKFEHWNIVVAPHTTHRLDLTMLDAADVVSLTVTNARGVVIEDRYLKNNSSDASDYTLAVTRAGAGVGRVAGSPAGIDCGNQCAAGYAHGLRVELTAIPDVSSHFKGWSGACTGDAPVCSFRIYETSLVTASFEINSYPLTVTTAGAGKVLVNPDGATCDSQCVSQYLHGAKVSLVATAVPGASFVGWSGACAGTDPICQVEMNSAKDVTATFYPNAYPLTVTTDGTGMVSIAPTGDLCEGECTATFLDGTVVTLEAKPGAGASFSGWNGACNGSSTICEVTMNAASTVQANFSLSVYTLTVTTTGAGTGTVKVNPGETSCDSKCASPLPYGTKIVLEAIPDDGFEFTGWFGACTGNNPVCQFTLRAPAAATASFNGQPGAALFIPLVTK